MIGYYVRPKPFPDYGYPHHKGWVNTKTNFSSDTTEAVMYEANSALNNDRISFGVRKWSAATAPARTTVQALDLTTPAYMLAGTDTAKDSLVGLDYFNPPMKLMAHYFGVNGSVYDLGVLSQSFTRTLAINHKFHFTNFHRFPLKVYYTVFPSGFEPPNLNSTDPVQDMTNSAWQCKVIPAVTDRGDRGRSGTLNIAQNLQRLYPNAYEKTPLQASSTQDTAANHEAAAWFQSDATTTSSCYVSCPPGQRDQETISVSAPNPDGPNPALFIKMFAMYDFPIHMGSTATSAPSGGTIDTAGFTIEADMNWLVEHVTPRRDIKNHPGNKAYPSQAA